MYKLYGSETSGLSEIGNSEQLLSLSFNWLSLTHIFFVSVNLSTFPEQHCYPGSWLLCLPLK